MNGCHEYCRTVIERDQSTRVKPIFHAPIGDALGDRRITGFPKKFRGEEIELAIESWPEFDFFGSPGNHDRDPLNRRVIALLDLAVRHIDHLNSLLAQCAEQRNPFRYEGARYFEIVIEPYQIRWVFQRKYLECLLQCKTLLPLRHILMSIEQGLLNRAFPQHLGEHLGRSVLTPIVDNEDRKLWLVPPQRLQRLCGHFFSVVGEHDRPGGMGTGGVLKIRYPMDQPRFDSPKRPIDSLVDRFAIPN